jgi:Cu+-exporting ATPase
MHETLKDPVCGMDVTYETARARSDYHGQTYYFCSLGCKEQFDENPEKYLAEDKTAHHE